MMKILKTKNVIKAKISGGGRHKKKQIIPASSLGPVWSALVPVPGLHTWAGAFLKTT
jgi:hypothetical protein